MEDFKNNRRTPKPIHEKPIGDILSSIDGFFQDTIKQISTPRAINVYEYETKREYVIEAELPGVKKNQISIDIYHNYIRIAVNDHGVSETRNEKKGYVSQSRKFQRAERTISLPFYVNESEVKATLKDGLLVIRIPNRRKRIQVD
ncbi:Hsp20/alpha crystallin family protein [Alteribacter keqinensis]|uniref:Hsp20/alpha crystallin family protein n=1 Tax=Alteribacter keqinensis TaxID=2483800 RepID=A0A3M7TZF9_9BACI|nr:Hsp20/alpha crystallin family protein [Alteribacter keqinensis]RNA69825.1 Hsp20/alpha crystallin family protein [Alteribacter keqinensis]